MPAKVRARAGSCGNEDDVLRHVLTDVGDVEITGLAIKSDPPGVTKTVRPHFGSAGRAACERIVRRYGVWRAVIDVDPQELAERFERILSVVAGIIGGTAIACRDVEIAVGTKLQRAAIVIGEWLRNQQQLNRGRRIRAIGIA